MVTNDFPAPGLVITKAVAGDAADLIGGPFTIQVDCKVGNHEVAGYPRDLTFDAPGSQEINTLPIGAVCTTAEPDTHGATSTTTAYDPDTNGTAVISGSTVAVASTTNTYDPATLTVSKTVVGPGPAGPWTFTDTCHLTSNTGTDIPVQLPDTHATFTLSSGQSHATIVPVGAHCTVTETATPAGDTVTYDAATTAPTVTVGGDTTLRRHQHLRTRPRPHPATRDNRNDHTTRAINRARHAGRRCRTLTIRAPPLHRRQPRRPAR